MLSHSEPEGKRPAEPDTHSGALSSASGRGLSGLAWDGRGSRVRVFSDVPWVCGGGRHREERRLWGEEELIRSHGLAGFHSA